MNQPTPPHEFPPMSDRMQPKGTSRNGHHPATPREAPPLPPPRSMDMWGTIRRGKWLILLALCISCGYHYWKFTTTPPVYLSSARLLVAKSSPDLPVRSFKNGSSLEQDLSTQVVLLRSPRIIQKALDNPQYQLNELSSLSGKNSLKQLISGLNVRDADSGFLDLNYSGSNPADCRIILEAVIDAYNDFLVESYQQFSTETVQLINNARDQLLRDIQAAEETYTEFKRTSPDIWRGNGQTNIHRERMLQFEATRSNLYFETTQLKAEIAAIEQALRQGGNREAIRLMVGKLAELNSKAADGTVRPETVEQKLFPMLLEEQLLLDNVGNGHPEVVRLRRRIELTRNFLISQGGGTPGDPNEKPKDFVTVYLEALRQHVQTNELKDAEYAKLLEVERANVKRYLDTEATDQSHKENLARLKSLFSAVVDRLGEITLVKDFGGYQMEVINPPSHGNQVAPNLTQMLTTGGLIGILVGLILAFIREKADKRFEAPEDIHLHLGIPVVGHIPHIPVTRKIAKAAESEYDLTLCTFHTPKSQNSEAYRAVRTSLFFNAQSQGLKTIQVTSPTQGDGKTTLATNLAVSIANSGKQVLLIDCDMRRPRVHRIFNLDTDIGLSDVIQAGSEIDPLQAVVETEVANLSVLPCVNRPDHPSELLTSHTFENLLAMLSEKYDYIILDTPPMLAVTDPSAVAARVDAVLMTIRLRKNSRSLAARASGMLKSIGGNVIGVVVNGLDTEKGYGYGGYKGQPSHYSDGFSYNNYGYPYGYSYGYGYGYSDKKYYADDAPLRKTNTPT